MGELDDMLQQQQQKVQEQQSNTGNSLLHKVSSVYMVIGVITILIGLLFVGILLFKNHRYEEISDVISCAFTGFANLGCGLFCLFAGCVGKAIDDIRNNSKK